MIKRLIHKYFYPFNKTLEVVLVSEEETYCNKVQNMLCQLFEEKALHALGAKCEYNEDDDLFLILLDETLIQFRLTNKTVLLHKQQNDENDTVNVRELKELNGDIVIFITSFEKYNENDFYSVVTETERFMCNVSHLKNVILAYFGVETLTENISNHSEWHNFINLAYCQQIQALEDTATVFDNIMGTVRHYAVESPFYSGKLGCNFFYANAEMQFGQSEFICNFLTHLLHFDKMNNYSYLIKN